MKLQNGYQIIYSVKDKQGVEHFYAGKGPKPSKNDDVMVMVAGNKVVYGGKEDTQVIIADGITLEDLKEITENGEYDIANFARINVQVPGATTKDLFEANANGIYNIAEYARVEVDVPNPSTGVLDINANGEYDVTEKAGVNVNVPNPSVGSLAITENGTYDVTEKAEVDVNVAGLVPTGNLEITSTAQVDVTNYATAQVVDANLRPENIKKGVTILGVTGTLEDSLDALMQETF